MRDRAGFAEFVSRLEELDVRHSIEEVPVDMFETAQKISRGCQSLCVAQSTTARDDEKEDAGVQMSTRYDFSAALAEWRCSANVVSGIAVAPCFCPPNLSTKGAVRGDWRQNLLTTNRESFVVLTATKGSHRAVSGSHTEDTK